MRTIARIGSAMALMAGIAAAQPAIAQQQLPQNGREQQLAQVGSWTARIAMSNQGNPMCVMSNESRPYAVHLKYFRGGRQLVLHFFHDNWDIPRDAAVAVRLGVDGGNQWNARASSLGNGLEITIAGELVPEFERAIRRGEFLDLNFPNHREDGWRIRLAGLGQVADAFIECMGAVNRYAGNPPRQAAAQAPAQAPRQPFDAGAGGKPGSRNI
jgi:hypothetical protein